MATGAYIGISGTARKVKKIYIGIGGVARLVTKAYIGVSGVARLFWRYIKQPTLTSTTSITSERYRLCGAAFNNFAVFVGGQLSSGYTSVINAVTSTGTGYVGSMAYARAFHAVAATNVDMLVGGGHDGTLRPSVEIISSGLSGSVGASNLSISRYFLSGSRAGSYFIFAGGRTTSASSNAIDLFNNTATLTGTAVLSYPAHRMASAYFNTSAFFFGGYYINTGDSYGVDNVVRVSSSGTVSNPALMNGSRSNAAAAAAGSYVLVGGGTAYEADYSSAAYIVDAFNTSITSVSVDMLTEARAFLAATSLGEFILFGGGGTASSTTSNYVDVYNGTLTHSITFLSLGRDSLAAATADDTLAVFAGGYSGSPRNTADIFKLA